METLKIGDVVQLKSGGPKMTIVDYTYDMGHRDDDKWHCTWFESNKVQEADFHKDALKKVDA